MDTLHTENKVEDLSLIFLYVRGRYCGSLSELLWVQHRPPLPLLPFHEERERLALATFSLASEGGANWDMNVISVSLQYSSPRLGIRKSEPHMSRQQKPAVSQLGRR